MRSFNFSGPLTSCSSLLLPALRPRDKLRFRRMFFWKLRGEKAWHRFLVGLRDWELVCGSEAIRH